MWTRWGVCFVVSIRSFRAAQGVRGGGPVVGDASCLCLALPSLIILDTWVLDGYKMWSNFYSIFSFFLSLSLFFFFFLIFSPFEIRRACLTPYSPHLFAELPSPLWGPHVPHAPVPRNGQKQKHSQKRLTAKTLTAAHMYMAYSLV